MTIDAWAAHAAHTPLEPFRYDPDDLGASDCEIEISHCGICHSDLHLLNDEWGATRYPLVPGHEIIGTVTAAGTEVQELVGKRVGVGWQRSACLACDDCGAGDDNLCARSEATCVGHHGGFARHIRTDARFAFEIPGVLESAPTAPLLCGGITVFSPLRRFGVGPRTRVGVIGIGGLGHLALRFASALGAEVTAFSGSPDKESEALGFGATRFVDTHDAASMRACTRSLDLLLTTVSAAQPWPDYMELLRPHGTLCFVGVPDKPIAVPAFSLIKGERAIAGSAIGSRARIREMLAFAAEHGIGAQVEVMPVSEVNAAIARLAANQARYRIVLEI